MKTIKTFFDTKNKRKFRITRVLLYKYLRDWKNKTTDLNSFYYLSKRQLSTLEYVLDKNRNCFEFEHEQIMFLKNIRDCKKISFGKYEYKF